MFVCSAELQDLAMEATLNDGRLARIPLKNRVREMEAHQFLHSRFDHMIEKRNAALQVDYLFCYKPRHLTFDPLPV